MKASVLTVTVVLAAVANADRPGRVVRIDALPRQVFVPAGEFVMGISTRSDDIAALRKLCETAFAQREPREFPLPGQNGTTSFCDLYQRQLEAMTDRTTDAEGHERARTIYLGAFAIDRNETTVAEYRACVAASACSLDPLIAGDDRYIRDDWPIVNITWFEAEHFCQWRAARLPTEAEWERAARGDNARLWPWGNRDRPSDFNHGQPRTLAMREIDRLAWIGIPTAFLGDPDASDGSAVLAAPGSYAWGEGPFGTRDQAGNVAEWTADTMGGISPTLVVDPQSLGYNGLSSINPLRDGSGTSPKVVRGGSWRQPRFLGRSNVRDPFNMLYVPEARFNHIGFRCARSIQR